MFADGERDMVRSTIAVAVGFVVCGCAPTPHADHRPIIAEQPLADSFAGSKAGEEREIAGIKLCWCPPGRFRMGSPPDEPERRPDETQVEVTLTRGFWIGKYEMTQGQWKRVVGDFP